jgi:hypothetical protein
MAHEFLISALAASYVRRLGSAAVDALLEQAKIARVLGYTDSAKVWLESADTAEEMLTPRRMAN